MKMSITARESARGSFCFFKSAFALVRKSSGRLVLATLALVAGAFPLAAAATGSSTVVISQVYGAGGNSGATLNADYVELFNLSNNAVDLTGWSLQYASTTGSFGTPTVLSGSIPAGGYYLVQASVASATVGVAPTLAYDLPLTSGGGLSISGTRRQGRPCRNYNVPRLWQDDQPSRPVRRCALGADRRPDRTGHSDTIRGSRSRACNDNHSRPTFDARQRMHGR